MSVRSSLPKNPGGGLVQVMRTKVGAAGVGAHEIAIGGSSVRNSVAFDSDTRVIEVWADVACRFRQGDVTVVAAANDHRLPAMTGRLYAVGGDQLTQATHFAVIQESTGGTLYITEME